MDKNKVLRTFCIAAMALGLSSYSFGEVIIIIEPDPDPIIIPVEPPTEPPVEPPPVVEPPQLAAPIVNVDPNVLNLKSNRQFITVYIEPPAAYSASAISAATVKITAINDVEISPINALVSPSGVGDEDLNQVPELMVKFDYLAVKPVVSEGTAKISISGTYNDGVTFSNSDTITVTNQDEAENGNGKKAMAATGEEQYRFSIGKYLPAGASIKRVLLWEKSPNKKQLASQSWEAWHYKSLKKWESVMGAFSDLGYSNLKNGGGYEWNLTEQVSGDWTQGLVYVVVKLQSQNPAKRPVLVVTYEDHAGETSGVTVTTAETQNLKPIGQKIDFTGTAQSDGETVTLCYTESDIKGSNESDIGVYYWDKTTCKWKEVADSSVDTVEKTISFSARQDTSYQVMAPRKTASSGGQTGSGEANALRQNYPNPFNPATTIEYTIANDCHVTMKLYNVAGEEVAVIVDEDQRAGTYSKYYDGGERLSRGIYYYQLIAGGFVDTKRMVVLR